MKLLATLIAAGALTMAFLPPVATSHRATAHRGTVSEQAFRSTMDKLWEEHVAWTRLAIVSFAGGLPDLKATEAQLLRNQVDIGNAIKPYYGNELGDRLTARGCPECRGTSVAARG